MSRITLALALSIALLATGCATSQNVTLTQVTSSKPVATAALVPQEGNSADMDEAIRAALLGQGVTPKPALPAGTRKSGDVDVIVSYTDQWRWDLAMYLRWVTINIYDAETGNMLATSRWDNSAFHGFQDYRAVVKELVDAMVAKVRGKAS